MVRLDLGCGTRPAEGFEGVDVCEGAQHRVDLLNGYPWPWDDDSVGELRASHFIEHIPQGPIIGGQDRFFWFFDEAYRVARPGAVFCVTWPSLQSNAAFQDPTHCRFIPIETMAYLNRQEREIMRVDHYNVRCDWQFEILKEPAATTDWKIWRETVAVLRKPL